MPTAYIAPPAVVESRTRSKKSRGGLDVFQFAQTVESDTWENEERKRNLQVRSDLQTQLMTTALNLVDSFSFRSE
jgi:hypothetical protein